MGVNNARHIRNLALVGFMGTGKSSVGRLVAGDLGFHFLDTDELIETRAGRRISELFAHEGEAAFRERERCLITELAHENRVVISTGGGLVANPANMASLKTHALVVCLWATPEMIRQRTRYQSHRPLLRGEDPLATIRELLATRGPSYRQADVLVNTDRRSVKEVAHQVLHQFQRARSDPPQS